MYFSKIEGHGSALSQFKKWLIEDSFQGCYLFQGPRGVGKHTIAQALSKYMLCNGTKDDTCRCENCRLFPNIPDMLSVGSGESIKVSDIQEIEKFISLVPYKSKKRVVLLDDLDNISYAAANSLLKIFEDIKDYAIIISVSSQPQKILSTLISRTTQIDFFQLTPEDYLKILKSLGYDSKDLKIVKSAIPYFSQSILSDYLKYLDHMKSMPSFVKNMVNMDEDDLLVKVSQFDEEKSLLHFSECFILYLNDVLKFYYDCLYNLTYDDSFDTIKATSEIFTDKICLASLEKVKEALVEYKRGLNVNLRTRICSALLWSYNYMSKGTGSKK